MTPAPVLAQEDSSGGLRQALLDTVLVQSDAPTRMREVAVLGIMSRGLRAERPPTEIRDTVASFRRDFDTQVARAGGVLEERRYSDALYNIMAGTLKSVVPVRWLGRSGRTVVDQIAGLAKGPFDEALLGEQISAANDFLDESYRGVSFLQPRAVTEFVRELDGAGDETRRALCDDLGGRASGLGASFCASDVELVRQIDARGGSAGTLRELATLERRIERRIEDGTYTDEDRAADRDELLGLLEARLRDDNTRIETYIGELEVSLDENERLVENGFDGVFGELDSVSESLDLLLFEELERELAEEERLAAEALAQQRRAEADEGFATGQLIATLIGVADEELGRRAQSLVSTGRAMHEALELYQAGQIGEAALTADFVGAGLALFSAFAQSDSPSPEQIMIEQLQQIGQQLQAISEQLARVDRKLDTVLDELARGFAALQRGQRVIIADISTNTRLLLETQRTIRAESNRLTERARAIAYGPCRLELLTARPLSDERYRECAYLFFGEAVELMYTDEVSAPLEAENYPERLLSEETIGRQTEALYELYLERRGIADTTRIASFESWYGDSSYYGRLLASSPAQAREAFPNGNFGLERIVENGEALERFRRQAADRFLPDRADPYRRVKAFRPLWETVQAISSGLFAAERRLAAEIGAPHDRPRSWYREWSLAEGDPSGTGTVPADLVRSVPATDARLSRVRRLLSARLPDEHWRAVNNGMAVLELELLFRDRGLSSSRCGSIFSPARCYRAEWDEWEVRVYLSDRPAPNEPIDPTTRSSRLAANLVFRVTENDRDRGLGRGPIASGPKLCQQSACFERAIRASLGNLRTYPLTAVIETLKARHEALRTALGQALHEEIAAGTAPELSGLDDRLLRERSYLAALTRFAFANHLAGNDALYAIASRDYEVPLTKALAARLRGGLAGFSIADRYNEEFERLFRLSSLQSIGELAQVAGLALEVVEATEGFRQLDRALGSSEPVPEGTTPEPSTEGGFVFARTDIEETRWIETLTDGRTASIWIDAECAEGLGGPARTGDWSALITLAPAFDEAGHPCN